MGGNALKSIQTHRLDAGEYHVLVPKVLDILRSVVGDSRLLCAIEAYRQQARFRRHGRVDGLRRPARRLQRPAGKSI